MKIQIFSYLHADVAATRPITVAGDIDAVVAAGDVCQGAVHGFALLRRIVPMSVPIITACPPVHFCAPRGSQTGSFR